MRTRSSFDQLARYADAIPGFAYAPFQNVSDAQLSGHLLDINSLALKRETGVSGNHEELLISRERRDDFFDHPIGKVILILVTRHVLKRQDGDGRLVASIPIARALTS